MDIGRPVGYARIAGDSDVVYLVTDDTTMTFDLTVFRGGKALWTVAYDGGDGVTAPTLEGEVPFAVRVLRIVVFKTTLFS